MTFEGAKKKLKKVAKGAYRSIRYSVIIHTDGTQHPECSLYIDGYNWHSARTWKEVFNKLEEQKNGAPDIDLNEEPKGEHENG